MAANDLQVLAHGGMGYAQEYHVERYLRECFVPRIAPVSKVSELKASQCHEEVLTPNRK